MLFKLYLKDVKVLLSDKKGLMIFILMPMVLTTILSFALSGSFGEPGKMDAIEVAIVKAYDVDGETEAFMQTASQMMGEAAAEMGSDLESALNFETLFFQDFLGDERLSTILKTKVMTEEAAMQALKDEAVAVVVILPEGFIYDQYVNFLLPNRNLMEIQIIEHPDYNYSGQIVESIFGSYFDALNKRIVNKNVFLEVGSTYLDMDTLFANIQNIMSDDQEMETLSHVKMTMIPGKKLITSFTYYSIAMMGMFILYSAGYMGRELLRERKMLTLDRGVVAGVLYGRVLAGKFLMTVTLCFLQMSALILYSTFLLGVDWEHPVKIVIAIFFSSLAVSGVGVFLSAITLSADNYRIANVFENLLIHVFALIGGSYIPLEVLPKIFMTLKYFALNGIVLDLFVNTYQNATWDKLGFFYGLLSTIALVFTLLAAVIIKRKEVSSYEGVA